MQNQKNICGSHSVLHDIKIGYPLPSVSKNKNYVKQIAAIMFIINKQTLLPTIKTPYKAQMNDSSLQMLETCQQLLLITNQHIVKAHYGYTSMGIKQK